MKKGKLIFICVFLLIILIGTFERLSYLKEVPSGLTYDEVSIGYNAYTILKTGKDQYGTSFPLTHFRSLDDYKLPFHIYLVSLVQTFISDPILFVRFPAAFFGVLTIFTTFFLGRTLFSKTIGIISALLISINPWHAFHSHLGLETNTALFFATSTILFFILSVKKRLFLIPGFIFYLLTLYTHHAYWVFLPLFVILLLIIYRKRFGRNTFFAFTIVTVFFMIPYIVEGRTGGGARLGQSFISRERVLSLVKEGEENCFAFKSLCIFSGVVTGLSQHFMNQYVSAFSFSVWYLPTGFDNVDVMPNRGLFYFFEFPLLVMGILSIFKNFDNKSKLLLGWLLLFPLSTAVTNNLSAARMYPFLPLPFILEAIGFVWLVRKRIIFLPILILIMVYSLVRLLPDMWYVYPFLYSRYTNYGPVAIIEYMNKNTNKSFYVEQPLLEEFYVSYFYKILPNSLSPKTKTKNGVLFMHYKNVNIIERGYRPPNKPDNVYISFPEDIPKSYKKTGSVLLKDNSEYAITSEFKN